MTILLVNTDNISNATSIATGFLDDYDSLHRHLYDYWVFVEKDGRTTVPLVDCIDIVKELSIDKISQREYWFNELVKARENGESGWYESRAYHAFAGDTFSPHSTVYDIVVETHDITAALETPEEYFAVFVSLH